MNSATLAAIEELFPASWRVDKIQAIELAYYLQLITFDEVMNLKQCITQSPQSFATNENEF